MAFCQGIVGHILSPDHRKIAADAMRARGLPGVTQKFTISGYDFYMKLAWCGHRLDYIDITVSGAQEHNVRALVELACKEAYALLRSGVWNTDKLIEEWMVRRFEPSGACSQIEGIAKSPIDAAARLIGQLRHHWEGVH